MNMIQWLKFQANINRIKLSANEFYDALKATEIK